MAEVCLKKKLILELRMKLRGGVLAQCAQSSGLYPFSVKNQDCSQVADG